MAKFNSLGLGALLQGSGPASQFASGAADFSADWSKAITEMLDKNTETQNYSVFHLDRGITNLPMSVTMVSLLVGANNSKTEYAVTFTLAYENPEVLNDRHEQQNGVPVTVKVVSSDLYTEEFITTRIKPAIANAFKSDEAGSNVVYYDAGFAFVAADLAQGTPEEITSIIRRKVHNIVTAIETQAAAIVGEATALDLTDRPAGVSLRTQFFNSPTELLDSNNVPQRSDFHLTVGVVQNQNQNQQNIGLLNQSNSKALVSAHGYIDVMDRFERVERPQNFGGNSLPPFVLYQPVVVLTAIKTEVASGESLGLWQLAIAANGVLNEDRRWANPLDPRKHAATAESIRDPGALATKYMRYANIPDAGKIDTRSNTFDKNAFINTILDPMFHDRPWYAIDVQRGGDNSWLASIISVLANPNHPQFGAALELWTRSADTLFNGAYTEIMNQRVAAGKPVLTNLFSDIQCPIHVGYYFDGASKRAPITNFDEIAVENLFPTDPAVGEEYASTYNPQIPKEQRLEKRLRIPSKVAGAVKVVDYANRYLINPEVIQVLLQCCELRNINLGAADIEGYNSFSTGGFNMNAPFSSVQINSNVFSRGTGNGNNANYLNGYIRW